MHLANNRLSSLPKDFYSLSLKELVLTQNCFREIPLMQIDAAELELLHVEKNLFYRLPNELLRFKSLQSFKTGWLQYCHPPLNDTLLYEKTDSSDQLCIAKLFDDFKTERGLPAWIHCCEILDRYSDKEAWNQQSTLR